MTGGPARGVCAVTGASGYVGSRVLGRLAEDGWEVLALSRAPFADRGSSSPSSSPASVRYELGDRLPPAAFEGVTALVHVAYDFSLTRWVDIERVNVEGSRSLFAAAQAAGVEQIVCVSSLAAFPETRSLFGRAKLAIERTALDVGAAVIRPGLVWGPRGASMFGALEAVIRRLPIVPLLVPADLQITLAHEDDLAALVTGLLHEWPAGSGKLLIAGSEQTLAFVEVLRSLALRIGRRPRLLRLPWRAVWLALRALELLRVPLPFRSDSLVSLVAVDREPFARATDSPARYGVRFRPYTLT